ncbi:MAG: protein kinase [Vicinamibacterales bacterium]
MTRDEWARVEALFDEARARPAGERAAWLRDACPAPDIRQLVEEMVAAHEAAPDFLEAPADVPPLVDATLDGRIGQRFGAYRVVRKIGQGGMGIVYEAVRDDDDFARRVAIKVLPDWQGEADADRFRRERRLLASLDHPGVARLLDAGETPEGALYFVMELVDGQPIDVWCREQHLGVRDRVALLLQVAEAVAYAHQRLVIHRDLKPANILVTHDGQPKLLDFGIAAVLADSGRTELTQAQRLTPAYASPEQIRGEPVTTASEVYSLGVLLFRLLTGRSPYVHTSANAHALAQEICEVDPPWMASIPRAAGDDPPAAVPRDLEAIVRKALRKAPGERYASVEQFAADAQRFLAGEPVLAVRGSTWYRARKFIGRHRWGLAAATVLLVLGSTALVEIVRQRRTSERRFNDVRELADVVIFDVDTAITDLPGSTPARKLIMQRAMTYLDRLTAQRADDLQLQRDIALAYERIGDVQGAPNRANLGELDAAEHNYRQALALRQAIAERTGRNADDGRKLARILRTLGLFLANARGDVAGALQAGRQALAVSEGVIAYAADDPQVRKELALDQQFLAELDSGGNAHVRAGTLAEAATLYRRAGENFARLLEATPDDVVLRQYAAIIDMQLADVASQQADIEGMRAALLRARPVLAELAQDPSNSSAHTNLAIVESQLAGLLLVDGQIEGALRVYEDNLAAWRQRLAVNPRDVNVAEHELSARGDLGRALGVAGRTTEALDLLDGATADAGALAQSTGSADLRLRRAFFGVSSAEVLRRAGRLADARHRLLESLKTYEAAAAETPANVVVAISRSMAEALLGKVALQSGDRAAALQYCTRAAQRLEPLRPDNPEVFDIDYALAESYACAGDGQDGVAAAGSYAKSLEAWRRAPAPGPYTHGGFPLGSASEVEGKRSARALR